MAGEIKDRRMVRRALDLVLPILLLALVSCGQVVFHDFASLDDEAWERDDTLSFMYDGKLDKGNTAGYDVTVEARVDASYPYKSLDVRVESACIRTGEVISVDTLRCQVYDNDGRRSGSTAGILYQVSSEAVYVPKGVGDSISFRLTQAMHDDGLHGIVDAGIRLTASSGRGQHQTSGR